MTLLQQIKEKQYELFRLQRCTDDQRVVDLINHIRDERKPQIDKLKAEVAELEKLREKESFKKPSRWPENTPREVIEICERYWSGTTDRTRFRIHAWNSKAIITSYPGRVDWAGVGTRQYYQAGYIMIMRKMVSGSLDRGADLKRFDGVPKKAEYLAALAELEQPKKRRSKLRL